MDREPHINDPVNQKVADVPPRMSLAARKLRVLQIFSLTFLVVAAMGLGYTFTQPGGYFSLALLAGPGQSAIGETNAVATARRIAGQQQLLFSDAIISGMRERLATAGHPLTAAQIRAALGARAVDGSNLVEIIARGDNPEALPLIVNTWVDVYLAALTGEGSATPLQAEVSIPAELSKLDRQIAAARTELAHISNAGDPRASRQERREFDARLRELQRSVDKLAQGETRAEAGYEDVRRDIERGKNVIPRSERGEITRLQRELDAKSTQLADLDARYTRQFLNLNPKLRDLPEQVEALRDELSRLIEEGNQAVLAERREELDEARSALRDAELELAQLQEQDHDPESTTVQYQAGLKALENLEAQRRQTAARLGARAKPANSTLPVLTLISRAQGANTDRGGGNITTDVIVALAAALVASLVAAWVYAFLNPAHAFAPQETSHDSAADEPQLNLALQNDEDTTAPPGPHRM